MIPVTPHSTTNNYSGSVVLVIDWDESTLINLSLYFICSCDPSLHSELHVLSCARSMLLYGLSEEIFKSRRYTEKVSASTVSVLGTGAAHLQQTVLSI